MPSVTKTDYTERTHAAEYCRGAYVWIFPEFIQMMFDDIVSLTALTLTVHPYLQRMLVDKVVSIRRNKQIVTIYM